MKSSLKFTAIALLLGGVLHVQNLNAAALTAATYGSVAAIPYDSAINPFAERVSRIFASPGTPKEFATSIEALSKTPSNTNQEKRLLLCTLVSEVVKSELPLTFFETALADDSVKVKLFVAACVAVKQARISSDITISEQSAEIDALTLALEKRVGAHTDEIIDLKGQVNELSEETELLQGEVCDLSSDLDKAKQKCKLSHAFDTPSEQSVVVPVATLPTYTVVKPELSTLPVAEQVYLLKVRSKLASQQEDLTASLVDLETLLQSRQTMALTSRSAENLERAAFLVDAIPQIRAIAMITGGYLKSVLEQINEINASVKARSTMFWRAYPEPLQVLQLKELEARKNLAYAEWDGLIGFMKKPQVLASSTGADNSLSSVITSVLVTKVQASLATLSETSASPKMVVKSDGLISIIGDTDYTTEVNLTSQFMIDLQQLTVDFLKQTYGAQTLLQSTFAPSALVGFSELVEAKASLLPPPAPPAEVVVLPATATNTVINSSDMDDSFHDDEDGLVDPAAVAVIKEEATV
jgi:hypothetical protein